MKKIVLLCVLALFVFTVKAQTKNGTVYSEHPTIETVKTMWETFKNGEQEGFMAFFADSVLRTVNGKREILAKERFKANVKWWSENIENLKIQDHKPAFPDAIEYEKGGAWVQDWLLFTGTHTKTGININVHFHNLYSFNDEGKINSIHFYYDGSVFDEITNSTAKRENGKVYINHPYIIKVRKLVNAYMAKDIETVGNFFDPKAVFSNSTMKLSEFITLEERKAATEKIFAKYDKIVVEQVGYPDCIYYAKNDAYVVYSWWNVKYKEGDKKIEYPVMLSHYFNKDGKIVREMVYYSTNHFE